MIDKFNRYRYGEYPTYYGQKQKKKNEFFFIYLSEDGKHFPVCMPKVTKRFIRLVQETRSDFPDMVDILNHYSKFSPEDFEADKILELPFEKFEEMAGEEIAELKTLILSLLESNGIMRENSGSYAKMG